MTPKPSIVVSRLEISPHNYFLLIDFENLNTLIVSKRIWTTVVAVSSFVDFNQGRVAHFIAQFNNYV